MTSHGGHIRILVSGKSGYWFLMYPAASNGHLKAVRFSRAATPAGAGPGNLGKKRSRPGWSACFSPPEHPLGQFYQKKPRPLNERKSGCLIVPWGFAELVFNRAVFQYFSQKNTERPNPLRCPLEVHGFLKNWVMFPHELCPIMDGGFFLYIVGNSYTVNSEAIECFAFCNEISFDLFFCPMCCCSP